MEEAVRLADKVIFLTSTSLWAQKCAPNLAPYLENNSPTTF